MLRTLLFAAIGSLMLSTTAQSAMIFFGEDTNPGGTVPAGGNAETARNSFLSNLVGVGNENFEGIASGTSANGLALSFPGSMGALTATISGSGAAFVDNSPGAGRFATSGSQFLENVRVGFNLAFSGPVAAFGFYGTDIGDINSQLSLTLTGGAVQNFDIGHTLNGPSGGLLFWGIIADNASETFTSIAFAGTSSGDAFGFDDMVIGDLDQVVSPIPLPAALPLFAAGLGLMGMVNRRRKHATA